MFGYITICKPELKIKDYYQYKGYYCGLCRTLKEEYGTVGQMTLNYDMTFLVLVLTSLYESNTQMKLHRCMVHPVKKIPMLQNEFSRYAADMNILLTYYHFIDDWKDEKSFAGLSGSHLLNRKAQRIMKEYPRQTAVIKRCLRTLAQMEADGETSIDKVAGCFGELMGELFVYRRDQWEERLRRFGFFLGKFIYLMDAYDDVEEDLKKQTYNPLKSLYKKDTYEKECEEMLMMMMAECSHEFEQLPCLMEADIIRNILYTGVWSKYHRKRTQSEEGKVQNNDKQSI